MVYVSANQLKKKGISLLDDIVSEQEEAVITVRGKSKYVILNMDMYQRFREFELEMALVEAKRDIEEGHFVEESVEDHMKRIQREI